MNTFRTSASRSFTPSYHKSPKPVEKGDLPQTEAADPQKKKVDPARCLPTEATKPTVPNKETSDVPLGSTCGSISQSPTQGCLTPSRNPVTRESSLDRYLNQMPRAFASLPATEIQSPYRDGGVIDSMSGTYNLHHITTPIGRYLKFCI